jgi:hypothetical protein
MDKRLSQPGEFFTRFGALCSMLFWGAFSQANVLNLEIYPSGHRPTSACEAFLSNSNMELSKPIPAFKNAPVEQKVKVIHEIAETIKKRALAKEQLQPVALRLQFLAEVSRKKLQAYADELLVIGHKLSILADSSETLESPVRNGLIEFYSTIAALEPSRNDGVAQSLVAYSYATLARLTVGQMRQASGRQKLILLGDASKEIGRALAITQELGMAIGIEDLKASFDLLIATIEQYDQFAQADKEAVSAKIIPAFVESAFERLEIHMDELSTDMTDNVIRLEELKNTSRFPAVKARIKVFLDLLNDKMRRATN